ncbi:MAG: FHA domain-containing protein [Eubacteriales bacterium]|nr:FHA domain-containing protein [Eubacteriales bacterium]
MIYEILLIALMIFLLVRQSKKKTRFEERKAASTKKMRNAQLDELLRNPESAREVSGQASPFDIRYREQIRTEQGVLPKLQMEVEVRTDTSIQRYLYDLSRPVAIGRNEKNDLALKDNQVPDYSCTVFVQKDSIMLRSQSMDVPILIVRGKNRQKLKNQLVKLQNKDILVIGRTTLCLSFYQN